MRSLLRGILRSESFQIVGEARNGVLALEFVERHRPDIVFLDVMMPEMDGLEALQNIKTRFPETLVIMITGNPSKENVEEAIQSGASGFIIKPFNSARVIDTLNRAWQIENPKKTPR
jgi:two-component system chemotaxis response regulator CheY